MGTHDEEKSEDCGAYVLGSKFAGALSCIILWSLVKGHSIRIIGSLDILSEITYLTLLTIYGALLIVELLERARRKSRQILKDLCSPPDFDPIGVDIVDTLIAFFLVVVTWKGISFM